MDKQLKTKYLINIETPITDIIRNFNEKSQEKSICSPDHPIRWTECKRHNIHWSSIFKKKKFK